MGKRGGGPVVFWGVHYEICPPVTLDFSFLDVQMMGNNVSHHHVRFERDRIIIKARRPKKVFFTLYRSTFAKLRTCNVASTCIVKVLPL